MSKLLFLATVFPPFQQYITGLKKKHVKFIFCNNRAIPKNKLLYKTKVNRGLGGIELAEKLKKHTFYTKEKQLGFINIPGSKRLDFLDNIQ